MDALLKKLHDENVALTESATKIGIFERVVVPAQCISKIEEAAGKSKTSYRVAKVGQADKMNQNERVYPSLEWGHQIKIATDTKIPAGMLCGAVDHAGYGGNLKSTPIIWKSLSMDSTGSVTGEFEVVTGHSAGKDLQAQLDAGMAIGFSTYGTANARKPSDAEMAQYGIPETADYPVIIQGWELKKIDAVDDPSVADAWTQSETRTREALANKVRLENTKMKTLEELKAAHPELFALVDAAIAAATKAESDKNADNLAKFESDKAAFETDRVTLNAKLESTETSLKNLREALAVHLKSMAESHGVEIPYKEVSEKDAADKIASLTTQLETSGKELEALKSEKRTADEARTAAEAVTADLNRQNEVKAKLESVLTGNTFAAQIKTLAEKQIADKSFDAAKAEAFVSEKTAEYAALNLEPKKTTTEDKFKITGVVTEQDGNANVAKPLPIAESLAASLL